MTLRKRVLMSAGLAIGCGVLYWCVMDVFRGEWRSYSGRVTSHVYVSARTEIIPYSYACGHRTCTGVRAVYHPEKHLVFVAFDGTHAEFNDRNAYARLADGDTCTVRSRIGRSGFRWGSVIAPEQQASR